MSVPEEVSCILQMVSEYLKEPCPITSLSGSQGPTPSDGLKHPQGDDGEAKVRRQANQVNNEDKISLYYNTFCKKTMVQYLVPYI